MHDAQQSVVLMGIVLVPPFATFAAFVLGLQLLLQLLSIEHHLKGKRQARVSLFNEANVNNIGAAAAVKMRCSLCIVFSLEESLVKQNSPQRRDLLTSLRSSSGKVRVAENTNACRGSPNP